MKVLRSLFRRLADRLPKHVAKKLEIFPESGMDYTIVAVKTKDGRVFRQIVMGWDIIGHSAALFEDFDNPDAELPFRLRDVVDIEWEGYRVGNATERPEPARKEWRFSSPSDSIEVATHQKPNWFFECTLCGTVIPSMLSTGCKCQNISVDREGKAAIKDQNSVRLFSAGKPEAS